MHKPALFASTAAALLLCAAAATAQMRERDSQEKGAPSQTQREPGQATGGEHRVQKEPGRAGEGDRTQRKAEPRANDTKGATQRESKGQPGKGRAQTEPRDGAPKGADKQGIAPRDKSRAEKGTAPRDKGRAEKGTAPRDKGRAEKGTAPRDKGRAEKDIAPRDKPGKGRAEKEPRDEAGPGSRVRLSEQQRTNVHQKVLKSRNVNRATRVNFSINVGTRIPRSVRLVPLPAAVISIVPQYRSYRYVVVGDRIIIVEPSTYEIVEVIGGSTIITRRPGPAARLVLTEEEMEIIVSAVDMDGDSTLGLGALSEGAAVPRGVEVRAFPEVVVRQVPKVRTYKFFTAEDRVAIVDPQGSRIQLVIEPSR